MLRHHRIAVIVSRFNSDITSRLQQGAVDQLASQGIASDQILVFEVPGAFELPLLAQHLLAKPEVLGVIALGAIIRGETPHFEYVASESARGLMDVMLATGKPVINGILTTDTDAQAWDRVGGAHGHKGADAADVLLHMISLIAEV